MKVKIKCMNNLNIAPDFNNLYFVSICSISIYKFVNNIYLPTNQKLNIRS